MIIMFLLLKVTSYNLQVTKFMQPMHEVVSGIDPIQTRPHFVIRASCTGEALGRLGATHMKY